MPQRDEIHQIVKDALTKDSWEITDDPYVIAYGERFLFVDLGAEETDETEQLTGSIIGAERADVQIAIEIKELRGRSIIVELEQAIDQYVLYRLLLNRVDPKRSIYLAIPSSTYRELFSEPIGEVVISDLPLQLVVVDLDKVEIERWIPEGPTVISSKQS